jgi:hypothetical protein
VLTTLVVVLAGAAFYLGKQLLDTRAEAAQLRSKVAYLQRRLSNSGQ